MIATATSASSRTSVCSDDHLNGLPLPQSRSALLYRQISIDSVDPNTMAVSSRMSSLPTYIGSPSFASDAASQAPLQIDDSSLYSEPGSHGLSPETGILTTRSGNTFQLPPHGLGARNTPTNRVRVLKETRVRRRPNSKAANTKPDKNPNPVITAPLSQLTQHMHHIQIKDMEAWVNRTTDVRRREVALKNGKIARPMNSFMLYRSAYAERTKQWCSQNNHQVVSRVSGQSWPMEPQAVREKYELLALIERDNHQKAHPEYKFAPNKTQTPPRKKRPLGDEDSDAGEAGYHIPANASPVPHKIIKRAKSEYSSRESTPFENQESILPEPYHHNSWPVSVGRHLPSRLMAAPDQQQHNAYYLMNSQGFPNMLRSSDDTHHSGGRPGGFAVNGAYNTSTGLAGIPGSIHQELLRPYGSNNSSNSSSAATTTAASSNSNNNNNHGNGHVVTRMDDSHLDPQLLSSHQAGIDMRSYNNAHLSNLWHHDPYTINGPMGTHGMGYNSLTAAYGGMQQLEEGQSAWPQGEDEGIAVPEVGKDFDQWIHSQNHHAVYGSQ